MPHPWASGATLPERLTEHARALGGQIALRWCDDPAQGHRWHNLSWNDLLDHTERQTFALHAAREADPLPSLWLPDVPGRVLLRLALLHLPDAPAIDPHGAPPPPPRNAPPRWLSRYGTEAQRGGRVRGGRALVEGTEPKEGNGAPLERSDALRDVSPDQRLYEIYLPTDTPDLPLERYALQLAIASGSTLAIGPAAALRAQLPPRPRLAALLSPPPWLWLAR